MINFIIYIITFILICKGLYDVFKLYYKNKLIIDNDILNLKNNYYYKNNLSNERIIILISHYSEDLFWIKNINKPFIIASKNINNKTLYNPINKGDEAMAYLSYIVKYYDTLPEFTFFCHGHYIDWHQNNRIDYIINNLKYDKEYDNINNLSLDDVHVDFNNPYYKNLVNVWDELFQKELGDVQDKYLEKCCAQFIVHRNRIRLRTKSFYNTILNYIINNNKNKNIGYVLEYIWHVIFGEPNIIKYNNSYDIGFLSYYI
jgi:hypothetical protein